MPQFTPRWHPAPDPCPPLGTFPHPESSRPPFRGSRIGASRPGFGRPASSTVVSEECDAAAVEGAGQPYDLLERPGKGDFCHPLVPVRWAREETRDAPVRQLEQTRAVRLLMLDPRELVRRFELTPPDTLLAVINECSMRPVFLHPRLFERPSLFRGVLARCALLVGVKAPAPIPHPVVLFNQALEIEPGLRVERLRGEFHALRLGNATISKSACSTSPGVDALSTMSKIRSRGVGRVGTRCGAD